MRLTGGDRAKAQDVVQETLLRAWRTPAVLDRPRLAARLALHRRAADRDRRMALVASASRARDRRTARTRRRADTDPLARPDGRPRTGRRRAAHAVGRSTAMWSWSATSAARRSPRRLDARRPAGHGQVPHALRPARPAARRSRRWGAGHEHTRPVPSRRRRLRARRADPGRAAAFEAHLLTCAECTARVRESTTCRPAGRHRPRRTCRPGFDPVPETLLPGLLRAARAAARGASAYGRVAGRPRRGLRDRTRHRAVAEFGVDTHRRAAFVPVAQSPVEASATLTAKAWGTAIDVHCHYRADNVARAWDYDLVAYDSTARHTRSGTGACRRTSDIDYQAGTSLRTTRSPARDHPARRHPAARLKT